MTRPPPPSPKSLRVPPSSATSARNRYFFALRKRQLPLPYHPRPQWGPSERNFPRPTVASSSSSKSLQLATMGSSPSNPRPSVQGTTPAPDSPLSSTIQSLETALAMQRDHLSRLLSANLEPSVLPDLLRESARIIDLLGEKLLRARRLVRPDPELASSLVDACPSLPRPSLTELPKSLHPFADG